jgi:hypothetical protein
MAALKVFFVAYVIDTLDTTEVEKACNAAKAKTALEYAKSQVDHLATIFDAGVKDVLKNNAADFKAPAKSFIICTAPEFYFKDRKGVPYSGPDMIHLMEHMKTKMPARADTMILPGTIWWWTSTNKNPLDFTTTKPVIHNTLPVLLNKKYIHTWQKEKLSDIDGLWDNCQQWDRKNKEVKAVLNKTQVPVFEQKLDGLTFKVGLEICLDHDYGILKSKAPKDLDIHILIACGMPADPAKIAARDGGVFLRCDGSIGKTQYAHGVDYARREGAKWPLVKVERSVAVGGGGKIFVTQGHTIDV